MENIPFLNGMKAILLTLSPIACGYIALKGTSAVIADTIQVYQLHFLRHLNGQPYIHIFCFFFF